MEKPILGPRIVRPFSARKAVEHFVPGGTFARSGLRRKKPLTTNTTDDNAPQAVDHITLKHSPAAVETGGASSRPVIGRSSSVPLHTGVYEHPGDTARDLARVRPDRERVSTGAKIILSHPAHNPQKPVPKPVEHEMILNEIRASPEYGIAWDLECWRIHETKRIEHELEEKERKQTAELTDRLRRTELEANRARERKRNELREREERLRVQEQTLMRRFEQLDEQERELVHRVVELDAREKRIREDTDAQVRRLKEDIACQAELHNRRLLDAQNTIHTLRNQIARLEVERAALWDSLNEAKMSMTAASNSTPHLSRHVLTANKAENEGTLTISAHYDAMLSRMHSENQKIVGALREEVRTLRAELALQQHCKRKKYVTHPRRGRTGRSVERLAPVQLEGSDPSSGSSDSSEGSTTESEDCNEHSLTARTRQPQRDLPSESNGKPKARSTRGHKEEVAKLLQTRLELIATKAYSESSEVILMLDQQIQALSKS